MWKKFVVVSCAAAIWCGCYTVRQASNPPADVPRVASPGDSSGASGTVGTGFSVSKNYGDGDPWPFRLMMAGVSTAGVAAVVGYWRWQRRRRNGCHHHRKDPNETKNHWK